ncbi:MAG: hypothetical protein AAGB04_22260 [Pseudomonadota bacterium]
MIEDPTVTEQPGDLGYLYDRKGHPHPILKRTNSFVFTDDPVSRAIAERMGYGEAGCRLKPFRIQRLQRWGFDAMPGRVPYDVGTRTAVERLGFVFVASLREDDVPRHTEDKWRARAQRREQDGNVVRYRTLLGLNTGVPLSRDIILTAFKQKAKEHHPDSGGDPELFRDIVEARDKLLSRVSGA